MLLAVEGGGFFSSSASGYSKGLAILLLGGNNEERPMRVSPWNQFHLLEPRDSDVQLALKKNKHSRGCATFLCFGRASIGVDGPSSSKTDPVNQHSGLHDGPVSENGQLHVPDGATENGLKVCLKSSLKKPENCSAVVGGPDNTGNTSNENTDGDSSCCAERRKVQWTDAYGGELIEVREYEVSEAGEDDFGNDGGRGCSCWIQ